MDAVTIARAQWHSAEAELFPALMLDPEGYQRAVAAVRAVADELRARCVDTSGLVALAGEATTVVSAACPQATVPAPMLVAVASALVDREFEMARRRQPAADGWAVLEGPADPAELTAGQSTALHVDSGTVLTAAVVPWSADQPFTICVAARHGRQHTHAFTDRAEWLAAHGRYREETG